MKGNVRAIYVNNLIKKNVGDENERKTLKTRRYLKEIKILACNLLPNRKKINKRRFSFREICSRRCLTAWDPKWKIFQQNKTIFFFFEQKIEDKQATHSIKKQQISINKNHVRINAQNKREKFSFPRDVNWWGAKLWADRIKKQYQRKEKSLVAFPLSHSNPRNEWKANEEKHRRIKIAWHLHTWCCACARSRGLIEKSDDEGKRIQFLNFIWQWAAREKKKTSGEVTRRSEYNCFNSITILRKLII